MFKTKQVTKGLKRLRIELQAISSVKIGWNPVWHYPVIDEDRRNMRRSGSRQWEGSYKLRVAIRYHNHGLIGSSSLR